ncbi:mRNA-capping enzyme subunit alpha [Golovinomyces cichoracearum]|uniref:mRNA-capping enzyme subunit alpha n=1 Tax=Golovinomyces cichoracearum TaxID=62708 RepID=A0A420HJQ4_9PEZI|nr:mRNA-capping enzyme subunit alpha [Golovinomyces cichoracearum]
MPLTSVDTPGIKAEGALEHTLREEIATLLNRKNLNFPGANPVSFSRKHLEELEREDYYVCEKSDGMRHLLYLTEDDSGNEIHYLINRKNEFWFIPPNTFHCPEPRDKKSWHVNTLIDGELVMDKLPSGRSQPKYLVFDCMILDGKSLMSRTLDKRLAYFKERVFDPYKKILQQFPGEVQHQHFIMELKSMQYSYAIPLMFNEILPSLPHGNDGLIFTCRTSEYKFGTDHNILKWKPENENSMDFRLRLKFNLVQPDEEDLAEGVTDPYYDYDALPIFNVHVFAGNNIEDPWYGTMHVEPKEWEEMKAREEPLDDRIVECFMDSENRWRFMRFRDDKKNANHITTVKSVIESITDKVTYHDLMNAAPRIREKWKLRNETQNMHVKKEIEGKVTNNVEADPLSPSTGTKRKAEDQGPKRPSPKSTGR